MAEETKRVLLTKDQLVDGVSKIANETKAATVRVMDAVPRFTMDTILKNLPKKGEIVSTPVPGFGTLGVKRVEKTTRQIPLPTGGKEEREIPAHYVPVFKLTRSIKTELNPDTAKAAAKAAEAKKAK
jgi:nucleoid DNA-binding protein